MNEPLRACPTCLTKVADVDLGLRDFRWASKALPGKVAPMDIDFALERNDQFLFIEFKPKDGPVGMGQFITLRALAKAGATVWLVRGDGPEVTVETLVEGHWTKPETATVDDLAKAVKTWFAWASEH